MMSSSMSGPGGGRGLGFGLGRGTCAASRGLILREPSGTAGGSLIIWPGDLVPAGSDTVPSPSECRLEGRDAGASSAFSTRGAGLLVLKISGLCFARLTLVGDA